MLSQLVSLIGFSLLGGGLGVGFLFTSLARGTAEEASNPVSRLYVAEGLGALFGGILFTFVLSARLLHLECLALSGGFLLVTAALVVEGRRSVRISGGLAGVFFLSVVSGVAADLDHAAEREFFLRLMSGGEIVARGHSHYGRLTLGRVQEQFFVLSDGRLDHVFPDPWDRPFAVHLAMSAHKRPERVLIIGGGPSDRLTAALSHSPRQVVLTYIDSGQHDLSRPFWGDDVRAALEDPRVRVVQTDGRRFVSHCEKRFDLIMVLGAPKPSSGSNRYHTWEFFTAARRALRDGGVLAVLAPGGANVLAKEAVRVTATQLQTMASVFKEVIAVPGEFVTLLATDTPGDLPVDTPALIERFESHGARKSGFSPRRFQSVFERGRMADLAAQLGSWPVASINTDTKPVAFLAGLQLWERALTPVGGTDEDTILGWAERWAALALLVPLVLGGLWLFMARPRSIGPPSFAIATTGAAGMAMEVTALYVYQGTSGQLYSGIALLVALFMAGLAAGAYWVHRLRDLSSLGKSVGVELCVLFALIAMGPVLRSAFLFSWTVWVWSCLAGAVTGAAFPILLGRATLHCGGDERPRAALMEAADHYGASFGALVSGVLWLPVYGLETIGLLFAVLKGGSLAGLLLRGSK